jgi:hypothetical protein
LAQQLKARDKAFRAANYYLRKAATTRHGAPMLAQQVREQALVCQAWLAEALAQPFDGTTVVVTHFAPSLRSADPRYGLTPGTAGFCNALDSLLPSARFWLTAVVGTILWTLDERLNPEVERANVWFGWYWLTAVAGHGSICCGKIWLR